MTRAQRICLWVYAVLVALCVVFFRAIERLFLVWSIRGDAEETLTVCFTLLGAVLIFATGRKKDVGPSIALSIFNCFVTGGVFYGVAWILRNILP